MSKNKITAVKGMNDLLPDDAYIWQYVEATLRQVAQQYGYREIRTPMLEKTALLQQSIGDKTDIVEKEMYTFTDAGKEQITLRPEATASTVRACNQHGLLHNQQQRLWYLGPMFRRERPQRGRYRQFHQFGIEAFGWSDAQIDAEVIMLSARVWKLLGIDNLKLHINTLGSDEIRANYRQALYDYLSQYKSDLDEDSVKRLETNPLRILDSKAPKTQEIIANAPSLSDFMQDKERAHFEQLCQLLTQQGIDYVVDDRLVRGLDYYTSTVFEWITDQLGAQATVCGGGRYDNLVEHRGGSATPAVGFAMGLERLIELVTMGANEIPMKPIDAYMIAHGQAHEAQAFMLAEKLRECGFNVLIHGTQAKLQNQLKRADKSGAILALIIGDEEAENNVVQVKHLRKQNDDQLIPVTEIENWFNNEYKHV